MLDSLIEGLTVMMAIVGAVSGIAVFLLAFGIAKLVLKRSWLWSGIFGVVIGVLGIVVVPLLFIWRIVAVYF